MRALHHPLRAVGTSVLLVWCVWTIAKIGYQPVPFPLLRNLHFSTEALGWLKGTRAPSIIWTATSTCTSCPG